MESITEVVSFFRADGEGSSREAQGFLVEALKKGRTMYLTTSFDPFTREFDRIVRRAFGPGFATTAAGRPAFSSALPMDTLRRDGEVVLRFDVPGVAPENIDVTVDHRVLTVSASREETAAEGDEQIVRERYAGRFTRRVQLPDNLNLDAIEATHQDGVLELHIPVSEEAKPRKITVGTRKELAS
jgi:HSP20 family protein